MLCHALIILIVDITHVYQRVAHFVLSTIDEGIDHLADTLVSHNVDVDGQPLRISLASQLGHLCFCPVGNTQDIEFLQGCDKDEMNTFMAALGVDAWNAWANGRTAEKLAQLTDKEKALVESYLNDVKGESFEPTMNLFSQLMFIAPQIRLSDEQAKAGGKSYTYFYRVESSQPYIKAGHASELPVVFAHPEIQEFTGRAYDEAFSKTMRKMWVQFAKTGNPSLTAAQSPDGKSHEWPLYDLKDRQVMVLDEFDIHTAKEAELKIVDWERTYFLTNYYMP